MRTVGMTVQVYRSDTREVIKSYWFKSYREGIKAACRLQRDIGSKHFYVMGTCNPKMPGLPTLQRLELD